MSFSFGFEETAPAPNGQESSDLRVALRDARELSLTELASESDRWPVETVSYSAAGEEATLRKLQPPEALLPDLMRG